MKGEYPPDRTAAGLNAAFIVGMGLLQLLEIGRAMADPRYGPWLQANEMIFVYSALEAAFDLWLCAGVYGGRRWAFIGKALFAARQIVRSLIFGGSPYALVEFAVLTYSLLRLTKGLGPAAVATKTSAAFLPDRLFGAASAAVNVWAACVVSIRTWPGGWKPSPLNLTWVVLSLAVSLWVNLGFFQSRGWAVVAGLFLASLGTLGLIRQGDEPLYLAFATYSALYAAVRLAGLGPKVEGLLALRLL